LISLGATRLGHGGRLQEHHPPRYGIVFASAAAALLLTAICLALAGTAEHGSVVALRATAVLSVPLIVGAYIAPALAVLRPGPFGQWLLGRRRPLWLAFFAVIAVHLGLILWHLSLPLDPAPTPLGLAPGFVTYLVMAAMALASFRLAEKAIGPARVHLLHRVGEHWVFAIIALGLLKGVLLRQNALYVVPLLGVLAAYAVQLQAWRAGPRPPNEEHRHPRSREFGNARRPASDAHR
jgi:hypothetical protein